MEEREWWNRLTEEKRCELLLDYFKGYPTNIDSLNAIMDEELIEIYNKHHD